MQEAIIMYKRNCESGSVGSPAHQPLQRLNQGETKSFLTQIQYYNDLLACAL
jgi:hypothetical protein